MIVSTPRPLKMLANSTAIYPAPIISILFGMCFKSNASSEVIQYSAPSIFKRLGLPPVAIIIFFDLITFFLSKTNSPFVLKDAQFLKIFTPEFSSNDL